MMRLVFPLFLFALQGSHAQETFIDGKKYVDYVHITFSQNVIPSDDATENFTVDAVHPRYSQLKGYLKKLGGVRIKKAFPDFQWGDTLRANDRGEIVAFPNLGRHYQIHFERPMPEKEVLDSLRKFPEVEQVVGPVHAQPQH